MRIAFLGTVAAAATMVAVSAMPAQAQPIMAVAQTAPASNLVSLPANTEVLLSMNDDLTTKGGQIEVGERFFLSVVHDVKIGEYIVIPRGTRGVGEVTWKTGKAAFGKSGKMEVALRYLQVGNTRIDITGKFRQEGEGNTVATIGAVIAVGVFGGFVTGKSARIPSGREFKAYTVDAVPVQLPTLAVAQQGIIARPATPVMAAAPQNAASLPTPAAPPAVIDIMAMPSPGSNLR